MKRYTVERLNFAR